MPRTRYFVQVNSSGPLYQKIADEIAEMIEAGTLRSGDRIPSVRLLSKQHRVSAPTVLQAYTVLENRRLIEARPRSGFYVRPRAVVAIPATKSTLSAPAAQSLANFPPLMAMASDITNPRFIPMGGANPGADLLPGLKLARLMGAMGRERTAQTVTYDPAPGCPALRHEISRRSLDWGCYLGPDEFLLTNGATEALHLALSAVTKPGDTVIVESPTYYGLLNILSALHLHVVAIPATEQEGLDLEATAAALEQKEIAAIVVIPNFSNPLGSFMPEKNRRDLLALAARHGTPIIEDDIYGDIPHDDPRPWCLKALDQHDQVMLCGSYSKTLAPGYRVGYLVSGRHQDRLIQLKMAWNFGSAPLPALAVAEFLRNGGYDHHLRSLRRTFHEQVGRMRESLRAYFPEETEITDPKGGFVLWVKLPPTVDALELFHAAREHNISIAPGHLFSPAAEYRNFIRISCGHPWSDAIEEGVATLGKLVKRAS